MTRLVLLWPLLVLACDTTVEGKNEVLRFRYDAHDNFLPAAFSTPIAAGLSARVEVFVDSDGGGGSAQVAANVIDASSSDASVINVVATAGNVITLESKAPGTAEIRVQSVRGDDAFDVRVVDVGTVDLSHPGVLVSDNPPSHGIVGGTARFIVKLEDPSGNAAVGFGEIGATVAPMGAATVEPSEEIGFLPVTFGVAGVATLTGLNDEPLTLEIVADADVTGLSLIGPDSVDEIEVDGELIAVLRGLTDADEKVVGVASLATVLATDPTVCSITAAPRLGEGAYLIEGLSPGECRVSAALGGRQVQHDLTVKAR